MSETRNLWGDIELGETLVTPVDILHQQAALLGELTNGVVLAEIEPRAAFSEFSYNFNLVVPVLDNYVYSLFSVEYGVSMYPVAVKSENAGHPQRIKCEDQERFEHAIGVILSSETTRTVIQSLAAQSRSMTLAPNSSSLYFPLDRYQATDAEHLSQTYEIELGNTGRTETANMIIRALQEQVTSVMDFLYVRIHPESIGVATPTISLARQLMPLGMKDQMRQLCNVRQTTGVLTVSRYWTDGDFICS